MKILDAIIKSITPTQTTGVSLRSPEAAEAKALEMPDTTTESGRIISDLKSQGYEVSSEEADRISEFIEKTDGTENEKLQTVKTALDKGLPLSLRSLKNIMAALFTPTISPELQRMLEDSGSDVSMEKIELLRAFAKLAVEEKASTTAALKQAVQLAETTTESGTATTVAQSSQAADGDEKLVTWLLKAFEKVAALSESLGVLEQTTVQAEPRNTGQESVRTLLQEQGLAVASSEREQPDDTAVLTGSLLEALDETLVEPSDAEDTQGSAVKEAVDQLIEGLKQQAESTDAVPTEALIQGISLLMKEITPKMTAVKAEFETLRKAVTADLKAVSAALESPETANKTLVVEKLSQAIERLDKAILKSDIPLYTSMTAEKQLLNWSSELQEARSLVADGQNEKASAIVDKIAKGVEAIQFQPAKLKVIHRTLQQGITGEETAEKSLQQRAQQQINRILEPIATPREVLEAFKALGLTHEAEVVSALGQSNKKAKEEWQPQDNLKEILMKLAADTQEKLTTVSGAEKTMNNLTGQQLLSRPEAKTQGQTLFFSVPMEMANRVEDLKIYVQSRKDQGKVDWENCTFYFAVSTEKYGDVGIRFAAARKSVSIQVKCDNQTLRDAVSPLVEDFKQAMWETGYKIAGISYSPLKDGKAVTEKAEDTPESDTDGKGLNIKV